MGLPENEALGPLLLEQLVQGPLRTGENVGWQRGAGLPRAAPIQLGDLEHSAAETDISVKRLQDTVPHDSADFAPKDESEFISYFEPHL